MNSNYNSQHSLSLILLAESSGSYSSSNIGSAMLNGVKSLCRLEGKKLQVPEATGAPHPFHTSSPLG